MPVEHPDFRIHIERLDKDFPDRQLVSKAEIAGWLKISTRQLRKRYDLPPGQKITKTAVARALTRG